MRTNTSNQSQKILQTFCNKEREIATYAKLLKKIETNSKFEITLLDTLLLNVCPTYSSAISMWIVHRFTEVDDPLEMMFVEVGKPDHNYKAYELDFLDRFQGYKEYFNNFIILKADNTGAFDYEWIKNALIEQGFGNNNILTAALFEKNNSDFKCDLVGEYYDGKMSFYFEKNVK